MRNILSFLFLVLFAGAISAQDIHYSQFYNSPLNVNPGKTGIFNGDKRINLSYRSQWSSVPVPWTTFSGSFDRKWYPKFGQKYFFSGGILLNHDRQGAQTSIGQSNFNITGSWTKILNEQNLFTIGAMVGYANRNFDATSLTWDNQWSGVGFDINLPIGEQLDTRSTGFIDNGIGLNYRWQKSKRTKLDLGVGVFHLIEPNTSIIESNPGGDNSIKMPRRISLTGVGSFQLTSKVDIQLDALAQFQGDYTEFVVGALGKIYVNQRRGKETELHLGVGYRTSSALFPVVAIQYKNIYVSANYDVNVRDFSAVNALGHRPTSFELHFNYIITDVRPLEKVKVCPIF
jgi:type IX secretion system PorP/SprF family membrane protein